MTVPASQPIWRLVFLILVMLSVGGELQSQPSGSFDQLMAAVRYEDAERVARARLAGLESAIPVQSGALAAALGDLAKTLMAQERSAAAGPLLARAIAIHEASGTTNTMAFLPILLLQADYANDVEDEPVLTASANRAVALAETLPATDPLRLAAGRSRGMALRHQGRFAEAVRELRNVLEIEQRVVPPDSLELSDTLQTFALVLQTERQTEEALSAARRAMEIREARADVARAGHSANLIGSILARLGDYTEARIMLDRAVRYRERTGDASGVSMARTLRAYADLLALVGDAAAAGPMYERALSMSAGRPLAIFIATTYSSFLIEQGDAGKVIALMKPMVEAEERAPQETLSGARAFLIYAEALWLRGDLPSAVRYLDRAQAYFEKHRDALNLGTVLALKGVLAGDRDGHAAVALLERGMSLLGPTMNVYPRLHRIRMWFAEALAKAGDYSRARQQALDAADSSRLFIRLALRSLSERQAIAYAAAGRQALDLAVATLRHDTMMPGAATAVFDRVVRARAIVLDEVSRRQQSFDAPGTREQHRRWIAARERLARIVVRGAVDGDPEAYAALRARAQTEAERAEEDLAAVSAQTRDAQLAERVGAAEVIEALGGGDALIAYVRYRDPSSAAASDDRYGAFVTTKARPETRFVPLGSAQPIDAAVSNTRAELLREARAGGRSPRLVLAGYHRAATALRQLVWDPVRREIGRSTRAFIVPDGALHLVSFAALPTGADRYLVDGDLTLHLLAAERDLVVVERAPSSGGLLAVGDPRFDDATAVVEAASGRRFAEAGVPCGDFSTMQFAPLPDSLHEAKAIVGLWPPTSSDTLLQGAAASETAIKQRARGHRVVHLATHGFFLEGNCAGGQANPLLRSGLAVAGANRRDAAGEGADDGILTAAEIASLDLSGTEWAVLSACDTGLGSIAAGEGVLGLQRAFRVAGAATVIMSLWSVDDRATRDWMVRLYEARLRARVSTADAVRTATRQVLTERRRSHQSTHPFYWAGFVASGDWR